MDGPTRESEESLLPPQADRGFLLSRQDVLRQHATRYRSYNWTPYRLLAREKKPPGKKVANILTADNIDRLLNLDTYNLGVLLGSESDGLVDLDLDWPEAAVVCSAMFEAHPCFGRAGAGSSHRLVRCPNADKSLKFTLPSCVSDPRLPDAHQMTVLEVRGTGHHTMFPPSIHPNGEEVKWEKEGPLTTIDWSELKRLAGIAAFLAVCIRMWPKQGSRDETSMALAGALLAANFDAAAADRAIKFVARAANDEEAERRNKAEQTAERRSKREPITGMTRLVELLGLPQECVNVFHKWLGTERAVEANLSSRRADSDDGIFVLDLSAPRENARAFLQHSFSLDGHRTLVFFRVSILPSTKDDIVLLR